MELLKYKTFEGLEPRMKEIGFPVEAFKKEASFACQIWNNPKNSYLRNATKESLLESLVNVAQIGLTLNPVMKEAFLVPRKNGNNVECNLEPSYIGLQKLITDAGVVKNIVTNIHYQNDEFNIDLITGEKNHKPYYILGKEHGAILGCYSIAFFKEGGEQYEYMTIKELNDIKELSESYKAYKAGKIKSCIWVSDQTEMIRKTVIRRIYKYLPKSGNNNEKISTAIELMNKEYSVSSSQINKIESLLRTSALDSEEQYEIEKNITSLTFDSAGKLIKYLLENQMSAIDKGNYSIGDIHKELDKIEKDDKK